MDASERAARGFAADEELVMSCPVYSDSDDDDDGPPAEIAPAIGQDSDAPPPSTLASPPPPPPPPPFTEPPAQLPPVRCSPAYLAEVRRRADAALHRAEAALADLPAAAAAAAALPAFALDVRDASELSVGECRREYVARFRPLVIRGVGPLTEPSPWTLPFLRESYGQKRAAVNLGGSQMAAACEVAGVEVMTLAELAARVESRSTPAAYLYDCSLPLKVPQLCERVGVPAYFSHDWLQRTRSLHAFSRSWPSLFVGATGTRSSLHIDQWKGHFWMAQLSGAKRWTIFHPDDAWCLSPSWDASAPRLEPIFPSLDEMEASPEQYPLLRLARRVDLTLRAGEVLLVPGGAPHRVRNGASDDDGDVSVAIAANFVDASNCAAAVADLKLMARRADGAEEDPGAAAAAAGLDELDPDAFADDDAAAAERVGVPPPARRVVPYSEYAKGCGGDVAACARRATGSRRAMMTAGLRQRCHTRTRRRTRRRRPTRRSSSLSTAGSATVATSGRCSAGCAPLGCAASPSTSRATATPPRSRRAAAGRCWRASLRQSTR